MVAIAVMSGGGVAATVLLIAAMAVLSIGLIAAAGSQGIERRARATQPYRGPSPLLVFSASIPLSVLAVVAVSVPLRLLNVDLEGPIGALLSTSALAVIYVGLVRLLVVNSGALDWREMGVQKLDSSALAQMAGSALWALPLIFLTALLAQILLSIFPVTPTSPLPPSGTAIGFAVSLLAGAVVAPFGEEIMFRAFATTAWVRGLGPRRGLILGALFFAFAHVLTVTGDSAADAFQLAFVAFAGRVPVALALGWVFLRRGSIWASFGLHATYNGVLVVLAELAYRTASPGG
jgi:membrane protease YdiL (CAAX protease family)